jgi:hypothetical protein
MPSRMKKRAAIIRAGTIIGLVHIKHENSPVIYMPRSVMAEFPDE